MRDRLRPHRHRPRWEFRRRRRHSRQAAPLRHRRFFALEELNVAIAELVEELNARPFRKLVGSRQSAYELLRSIAEGMDDRAH